MPLELLRETPSRKTRTTPFTGTLQSESRDSRGAELSEPLVGKIGPKPLAGDPVSLVGPRFDLGCSPGEKLGKDVLELAEISFADPPPVRTSKPPRRFNPVLPPDAGAQGDCGGEARRVQRSSHKKATVAS
jgi:hypothetical protein